MVKLLLAFFISTAAFADHIEVSLSEHEPVIGESFYLNVKIRSKDSTDPNISFDPGGLDVIGRNSQGVTFKTTYINGRLETSREISYKYELVAPSSKSFTIRKIQAVLNGETLKHKNVRVKVVKEARQKSPFFVRAESSKTEIYKGEGILVNYYLYQRDNNVIRAEIKRFPKLSKFLKRFQDKSAQTQTVSYNGVVYKRTIFYSAYLFPETTGKLKIDPISLQMQYSAGRGNDPFGSFGFGFGSRRVKKKVFKSQVVEITVLPLPDENVPKNFTGLVGLHKFSLDVPKSRFLTNEAIETTLTVEGGGALENLDAPSIFTHQGLEEFDTKSDLDVSNVTRGRKTFQYTFLGREPFKLDARDLQLSYFDPDSKKYVDVAVSVPELVVFKGGGGASSSRYQKPFSSDQSSGIKAEFSGSGVVAPDLDPRFLGISRIRLLNRLLLVFIVALFLLVMYQRFASGREHSRRNVLVSDIKKHGFTYSKVFQLINLLDKNNSQNCLDAIVDKSELSSEAKSYFKNVVAEAEQAHFTKKRGKLKISFDRKHFKEFNANLQ